MWKSQYNMVHVYRWGFERPLTALWRVFSQVQKKNLQDNESDGWFWVATIAVLTWMAIISHLAYKCNIKQKHTKYALQLLSLT